MSYKSQNFSNGTAEIIINDSIVICEMFQDQDGDIGFYFDNNQYYFKDIKRV